MTTQPSPGLNVRGPCEPIPGIPPNMSLMAALSAGLIPLGAVINNFGVVNSAGGRSVASALGDGTGNGTAPGFTNNGGSANYGACGGQSFSAGGMNQTNAPGGGDSHICPHSAPASLLTFVPNAVTPTYTG